MAKIPFVYYLHDMCDTSERYHDLHAQDSRFTEEIVFQDMGRPFYEIKLLCEYDTETCETTILGVEQ